MEFWGDDRAQSVQIGAVLLFGILIIAIGTYQAQVVPSSNAAVEFEHAQQVEGEFIDLRSSVLTAARTGNPQSTALTLGTRYPRRTFFVNPPPATGTVSTSSDRTLRIENATVNVSGGGNVEAFWDAHDLNFSTQSIRYVPRYNEYDNPPELVYEHSLVVAEFDRSVLARTGQTAVENDELSLTLIDGNLSESGVGTRGIDTEVLSRNARSVTVQDDGGPIVLVLPTTVDGVEKREKLAQEWAREIETDANVTAMDNESAIRIELPDATEEVSLRLSQIGVGSDTTPADESNGYIKAVGNNTTAPGEDFTVEVRDQFNNPVSDATVTTNRSGSGSQSTDEDGRATFTFANTGTVELSINDGNETWETVNVTVSESAGGGGDGDGRGSEGGGSNGVGTGGTDKWTENDRNRTISTSGGIWSGIDNVNAVVLREPRLTPIGPQGDTSTQSRYFRFSLVVGDPPSGDTRYVFVFPEDPGTQFQYNGSAFTAGGSVPILVIEESPSGVSKHIDGAINQDAFQDWYHGGKELNLLNTSVYANNYNDPVLRDKIETIREQLFENENQEAYIADMRGRVNLTLERRQYPVGQAASVSYNNDASTAGGEDAGVQFSFDNTGSDPIEIESIAVESTSSTEATVIRERDGGSGADNREIFVTAANDGYYEAGDGGNDRYSIGQIVDLTSSVTVNPGGTATVSLTRFYDGGSGGSGNNVNMSGEDVTVKLYFTDGTTETITLTPQSSSGGNSAESIETVGGSTPGSESASIEFSLENTGSEDVTITQFNITTPGRQNSAVSQIDNINNKNSREVEIAGGGTTGFANAPGNGNNFATDGTTYSLDTNAVINSASSATVSMGEMNGGNIQLTYETTTEPNADIVVNLTLSDGSTKSVYLRVTNVNS